VQPVQPIIAGREHEQAQDEYRLHQRGQVDELLHQCQRLARPEQRGGEAHAVDDHQNTQQNPQVAEVRQGARVGVLIYTHRLIM
jgi:hypothetical protein